MFLVRYSIYSRQIQSQARYFATVQTIEAADARKTLEQRKAKYQLKLLSEKYDAPQGKVSGYNLFIKSQFKNKDGNSNPVDFKATAKQWSELDLATKNKFVSEAEKVNLQVADQKINYLILKRRAFLHLRAYGTTKQAPKDPKKPKKPLSGFMKFTTELRKNDLSTDSIIAQSKNYGQKWKLLSETEKQKYNASAQEIEKYNKDMEKYLEDNKKAIEFIKSVEEAAKEKYKRKPKRVVKVKKVVKKKKVAVKAKKVVKKPVKKVVKKATPAKKASKSTK
ncbi:hypothetical protein HDV02_002046 [Globomyces sp. JEL0801]|nr:hypothetical protein HDV02_002046 [Globomyces sp. JEL0801]